MSTTPRATVVAVTAAAVALIALVASLMLVLGYFDTRTGPDRVVIPETKCTDAPGTYPCLVSQTPVTITDVNGDTSTGCLFVAYSGNRYTLVCEGRS